MRTPATGRTAAIAAGLLLALAAIGFGGCGDSADETVLGPRALMLRSLTDVVILPTYRTVATNMDALTGATAALLVSPSLETLAASQDAWRRARAAWKQSEAFRFGPSEDLQLRIRSKLDWSPVVPARVEEQIAASAELTPEHIDTLGANRRGLLAIEYLLFDPQGNHAEVLRQLTGPDGERRRQFVDSVARDMATQARRLVDAWEEAGGNFRSELFAAGHGSAEFPTLKSAIDTVVGAVVLLGATIEENKLGRPFGTKSGGEPRPESVEAGRSANSVADIVDNLDSIRNVYLGEYEGGVGPSMRDLVVRVSPAIDEAIQARLYATRLAVRELSVPLAEAVLTDRVAVQAALDAATELRAALAVDLVSALGATPRFVGDGD